MNREFKQETLRGLSIAKYATYKANGVNDVFILDKYKIPMSTLNSWKFQNWRGIVGVGKLVTEYNPLNEYLRIIQDLMRENERLNAVNRYLLNRAE